MFDGKFVQINLDVSRFFSFGGSVWLAVGLHCSSFRCQEIEIGCWLYGIVRDKIWRHKECKLVKSFYVCRSDKNPLCQKDFSRQAGLKPLVTEGLWTKIVFASKSLFCPKGL